MQIHLLKYLRFTRRSTIFIFNSTINKHLGHSYHTTGEVRIVVQAVSNLELNSMDEMMTWVSRMKLDVSRSVAMYIMPTLKLEGLVCGLHKIVHISIMAT